MCIGGVCICMNPPEWVEKQTVIYEQTKRRTYGQTYKVGWREGFGLRLFVRLNGKMWLRNELNNNLFFRTLKQGFVT